MDNLQIIIAILITFVIIVSIIKYNKKQREEYEKQRQQECEKKIKDFKVKLAEDTKKYREEAERLIDENIQKQKEAFAKREEIIKNKTNRSNVLISKNFECRDIDWLRKHSESTGKINGSSGYINGVYNSNTDTTLERDLRTGSIALFVQNNEGAYQQKMFFIDKLKIFRSDDNTSCFKHEVLVKKVRRENNITHRFKEKTEDLINYLAGSIALNKEDYEFGTYVDFRHYSYQIEEYGYFLRAEYTCEIVYDYTCLYLNEQDFNRIINNK